MSENSFKKIMVEVNGVLVNITDLQKEHYEYFLDLMQYLRVAYYALSENKGKSKILNEDKNTRPKEGEIKP